MTHSAHAPKRKWKWLLISGIAVFILLLIGANILGARLATTQEFDAKYLLNDGGEEARRLKDTLAARLHLPVENVEVAVYSETPNTYNTYAVCLFRNIHIESVSRNELKTILDDFYPDKRYESTIKFYLRSGPLSSEFHSYHLQNTNR